MTFGISFHDCNHGTRDYLLFDCSLSYPESQKMAMIFAMQIDDLLPMNYVFARQLGTVISDIMLS